MQLQPTLLSASVAGASAGILLPLAWSRFGVDTFSLVVSFLVIVALPAHAFVVGFGASRTGSPHAVDVALLKRVGVWLAAAGVTAGLSRAMSE